MLLYMSIAILKKKSRHNRRIAPISGRGVDGFSLNGGTRNHGGIGQFRMISNTTRTPYRGTEPMGNGGHLGTYYNKPFNSGSCCFNDNTIIKKSTMNTAGMIDTKYKWTKGTYPNYWVQEDDNSYQMNGDQATYIRNLTQATGACVFTNVQNNGVCGTTVQSPNSDYIYSCKGNSAACSYHIGGKKYIRMPYAKNLNQPAVSQGQYITGGGVFNKECLPTPASKKPFPMNLNHSSAQKSGTKTTSETASGCYTNYLTWQDAYNAGQLPADWTPGYSSAPSDYSDLVQRSSNFRSDPPSGEGYPEIIPNT